MIHSNQSLTKTIKFTYLIGALRGEAKKLVQGFEVNGDNYDAVIKLLKERYEDKRRRIRILTDELLELTLSHHNVKEISLFHENLFRIGQCLRPLLDYD